MSALKSWIAEERETLIWIDYADYATEIIGAGAPWDSAAGIAGLLNQAQALLQSEVVSLDAGRILLDNDASEVEDPLAALLAHLQDPARIQLLSETVEALAHGGGDDLVLQLPGPRKSLQSYGADEETASDFGNLDDLGAVFTDIIRALADKPLSGLLLTLDEDCEEDEFDALGPVVAAAMHYGWTVASELSNSSTAGNSEYQVGQLILLPQASGPIDGIKYVGGGLTKDFWQAQGQAGDFALRYGRVPRDAIPEIVLAQRKTL